MRHRKAYRKFGLPSDQRRALLKGLTRSLLLNDRIITTETRAKEVRPDCGKTRHHRPQGRHERAGHNAPAYAPPGSQVDRQQY